MLSQQLQIELLNKFMYGEIETLPTDKFSGEWLEVAWRIKDVKIEQRGKELNTISHALRREGDTYGTYIKNQIINCEPEKRKYQLFSQEEFSEVEFLWDRWLLKGYINMLVAESGYGKSFIALDIARRIAMHGRMPDGSQANTSTGRTIWIDTEMMAQIAHQRMKGWRKTGLWNGEGIYRFGPMASKGYIDFGEKDEMEALADWCHEIEPDLVILDSFNGGLAKGLYKEQCQRMLSNWHKLAVMGNFAFVIIHHPRKSKVPQKETEAMHTDDIASTKYLVQYSRITSTLHRANEGGNDMVMSVINSNVEKPEPLLVKQVGIGHGQIKLEYEPYERPGKKKSNNEECEALIFNLLEKGELSQKEINEACKEEGYGGYVVRNAIKAMRENGSIKDTIGKSCKGNKLTIDKEISVEVN